MKTIKRERQVRLDELISYVWKNEITSTIFQTCKGKEVNVGLTGIIYHEPVYYFSKEDLFLIEEEVEITEDTKLNKMISIDSSGRAYTHNDMNIKQIISFHKEEEEDEKESLYSPCAFIYLQNDNGSIGELIWKDGEMID